MRDYTTSIQWFEKFPDLMPGKLFFSCERLSAHITFETCRQNHEAAHQRMSDETPLRLLKCRECSVGRSLHTDSGAPATWQDVRRSTECVRCGRLDLRLIAETGECVSCWNRRRESRIGKNARGRPPQILVFLTSRRVGLVINGKPAWRQFDAWHEGEAISRATRKVDGAKFHDVQPGKSVWNHRVGRFQYRCRHHGGEFSTLVERRNNDGTLEYICPVCRPNAARALPDATVKASASFASPGFVKELLELTGASDQLTECFKPTTHVCDRCQHYAIEAKIRGSQINTRCPMCDAEQ